MPAIRADFGSDYPFVLIAANGQPIQAFKTYIEALREYVFLMHMFEQQELSTLKEAA